MKKTRKVRERVQSKINLRCKGCGNTDPRKFQWHNDHAFVGAIAATEAFLWDKERGLVAQFTSWAG